MVIVALAYVSPGVDIGIDVGAEDDIAPGAEPSDPDCPLK